MNGCVIPSGRVGIAGVTAIVTSTAGVTVTVVVPATPADVAVTPVLPTPTLLTRPCPFTVATPAFVVLHVTVLVRFSVLPSVYVPVAVMACVVPSANEALAGVTDNDTSTGAVTFRVAVPSTAARLAVIVAVPTPAPMANPPDPIVAIASDDVLQLAADVRFCWLPSLYVPVATYCCVVPFAIAPLPGLTANDTSTGGDTVTPVDVPTVPELALIFAVPNAKAITKPLLLTGATVGESEAHVTELVRSCVLPSV